MDNKVNNKVNNKLTPSLLGGGANSTHVCLNERNKNYDIESLRD